MNFIKSYFTKRNVKRHQQLLGYLAEAGVPPDLHGQALKSLETSRALYFRHVLWIKLTAWFMTLPIVLAMKWEDEDVPLWGRWYGNNISPNGDRTNWREDADGYGRRIPQPLAKDALYTDYGEKFNYYAWNFHVRFWLSRWVWLGFRNPGAGRALQVGPNVFHLRRKIAGTNRWEWPVEQWGNPKVGSKDGKSIITGTLVHRIGEHWQVTNYRNTGAFFGKETNVGYKINNLAADFPANEPDAGLCVCNGHKPFRVK